MARCDLCKQFDDCAFRSDPDAQCSEFDRKPMTNGDKIRSMSDEELNKFIDGIVFKSDKRNQKIRGTLIQCKFLDWLREEATDGNS